MDKLDPVFAESGVSDTNTIFDAWAGTGYLDERVRYKGLNKVLNRADNKINETIDRAPHGVADDVGDLPFIQNLFTPVNEFSNAAADLNVFDLSGDLDDNILDFCVCKIDGERKILIVDENPADDDPIKVFDIATGAYESGSGDQSAALTTPTTDWDAVSICADATYCYVMFRDVGPTPDEYRVQSFALADWSVNPGWPATGLALTAGAVACDDDQIKIRNASDSKLVATQPWVAVSSGTSSGLNIIDKAAGTSDGTGAGNVGSVASGQVSCVCSDGTTVFFVVELAAGSTVCGMTIASPGANGPSGIRWPGGVGAAPAEIGNIACSGNLIVVTYRDGSYLFSVHHTENGTIATYATADDALCYTLGPVCFDGKSFWALGERDVGTSNYLVHMFKLRGADRGGYYLSADPAVDAVADGEQYVDAYATADILVNNGTIGNFEAGVTMSDGRDVWFCGGAAQMLYRLPRTVIR